MKGPEYPDPIVSADPFKSLPPTELLDVWVAAARITDGYAMVNDDFRLSAVEEPA